MMDAVIAAGERLAEALRAENEALAALDLTRAAALATRKMQATARPGWPWATPTSATASPSARSRSSAKSAATPRSGAARSRR